MKAIFNDQTINDQLELTLNDRALQFGDGVFETMYVEDGKIRLLEYHYDRLLRSVSAINLSLPAYFTDDYIQTRIEEMNNEHHAYTVKLMVWRKSGYQKGYSSLENETNIMFIPRAFTKPSVKRKVSVSEDVRLHYWKYSRYKTMSALPYVMASAERDQKNLDDLIILNTSGNIAECTYANLFWIIDHEVYTPSLKTGCIDGVMRRHLITYLQRCGYKIHEVETNLESLKNAEIVFTSNSSGLSPITHIDSTEYAKSEEFVNKITRVNLFSTV